jgi:hypothetical protein
VLAAIALVARVAAVFLKLLTLLAERRLVVAAAHNQGTQQANDCTQRTPPVARTILFLPDALSPSTLRSTLGTALNTALLIWYVRRVFIINNNNAVR